MDHVHAGAVRLAVVVVGVPITAADRAEDADAGLGAGAAGTLAAAVTVALVAELPVLAGAVLSARLGLARALVGDVCAGAGADAVVAVGVAVTAADGGEDQRAAIRPRSTLALLGAHRRGLGAILIAPALGVVAATVVGVAGARVGDAAPRRGGLSDVAVGVAVAAADRVEEVDADVRAGLTDAGLAAGTGRLEAELTVFAATVVVTLAGGLLAGAARLEAHPGGPARAIVGVGVAVAAADRVEDADADLGTGRALALPATGVGALAIFAVAAVAVAATDVGPTRSVGGHRHPGGGRDAGVAVGVAVAATDGVVDQRADLRPRAADALAAAIAGVPHAELTIGAVIVAVAHVGLVFALAPVEDAGPRRGGLADVAVVVAVAAADRRPDVRAGLRTRLTDAAAAGLDAGAVLAAIAVLVAFAAGVAALALVGHVGPGHRREAGVLVGVCVAATDGIVDPRAGLRSRTTGAVTVAAGLGAELLVVAVAVVLAALGLAGPFGLEAGAGAGALAVIGVGVAVAAADRIEQRDAGLGSRLTDTTSAAGPLALAELASRAVLVAVAVPRLVAARTLVLEAHTRGLALAVVAEGHAVAPADGVEVVGAPPRPGLAHASAARLRALAELAAVTVAVVLAVGGRLPAGPLVGHVGSASRRLAAIAVGLAVTAADREEDQRTQIRTGPALTLAVAHPRLLEAQLGPLAVAVVTTPRLLALAVVVLRHAGAHPLAVVGVGVPVAAADRRVDSGARVGSRQAAPQQIRPTAHPGGHLADLTVGARDARDAAADADQLAGPLVEQARPRPLALAVVGVGLAVAAADRAEDARARLGTLGADARRPAGAAALAEPIGAVAIPATQLRGLLARTPVIEGHARRPPLAVVAVGLPVAATHRIEEEDAQLGAGHAAPLTATDRGLELAELVVGAFAVAVAGPRLRLALARMGQAGAGTQPLAVVTVGLAVAAADGVVVSRADLRLGDAGPRHPAGPAALADLALAAVFAIGALSWLALAVVVLGHTRAQDLAVVGVGVPVAAADRRPEARADVRALAALAGEIGDPAPTRGELTDLAVFAGRAAPHTAGQLATRSVVGVAGPRGHALAVVVVGVAVAAADRVDMLRARVGALGAMPALTAARLALAELAVGAVLVAAALVRLVGAGALVGLGDPRGSAHAVVTVGVPVAAADRRVVPRADLGTLLAGAFTAAGPVCELAEGAALAVLVVVAADLSALALVGALHAGADPLAVVAVGAPIATADRLVDAQTRVGDGHALALEIGAAALTLGQIAELAALAGDASDAATGLGRLLAEIHPSHEVRLHLGKFQKRHVLLYEPHLVLVPGLAGSDLLEKVLTDDALHRMPQPHDEGPLEVGVFVVAEVPVNYVELLMVSWIIEDARMGNVELISQEPLFIEPLQDADKGLSTCLRNVNRYELRHSMNLSSFLESAIGFSRKKPKSPAILGRIAPSMPHSRSW